MPSALPFSVRTSPPEQVSRGRVQSVGERYAGVARARIHKSPMISALPIFPLPLGAALPPHPSLGESLIFQVNGLIVVLIAWRRPGTPRWSRGPRTEGVTEDNPEGNFVNRGVRVHGRARRRFASA